MTVVKEDMPQKDPKEQMALTSHGSRGLKSWLSKPMRDCLVLSLSFTFVYTAYLAIQNLQSSLNQSAHLGVTSLAVLYGTIIIFGTQAPTVIRLLGAKNVLLLAWVVHIIYTSTNFYPSWGTLIPSSALMGAMAGPMWTAQGLFITASGEQYAQLRAITLEKGMHSVLSKFNGLFFMFYEITQVTGNLISSLVLSTSSYDSEDRAEKLCGAQCSLEIQNSTNASSLVEKPEDSVVYTLLSIFLACNVAGFCLTFFALPKLDMREETKTSGCTEFVSCFKMVADPRMIMLLPLFMGQAMAIGILYADYTKDYVSCSLGVQWVGFVMASYGACCAIFAISINSLAHPVGRIVLFIVAVLADVGTMIAMLIWAPSGDHIAIFFIVPAVSGISEGIMQAQFNTLIAQVFTDNLPPAFATYHTSKALSFTLTFVLSTFLCLEYRLYISIALYGIGLGGYLVTEWRLRRTGAISLKNTDDDDGDNNVIGTLATEKESCCC